MNVAIAIAGLAFLVLIHEAGHFVTALAVRMRPRKFYIFFPPPLVRTVRNGIEYGIGTIPLGGYVKIPGMHRPAGRDLDSALGRALEEAPWLARSERAVRDALDREDHDAARAALPELQAAVERAGLSEAAARGAAKGLTDLADGLSGDAYWRAPAWKRIVVIAAGPFANLVFCVAMLAIVFSLGVVAGATRAVEEVIPASPAAAAGLRQGDVIVAVDGVPTDRFEAISDAIRASEGRPLTITVLRDGSELTLGPIEAEELDGRYRIGFVPTPYERSYPPGEAIAKAFEQTGEVTVAIGKALAGIVTGSTRGEVSSAVGIVDQSSQVVEAGFRYYLGVLALISLSLALLNLLPLLPLDGGHIAFSLAEKVRGRAIPREAYERASMIGIALVLLLFFIGLSNDIERLRGG
ncbi:MAG: site-2 protease family protein [Thermoleophilia bacterium]|nr:site-2 protease family protein [Thermoleophilia bacterium]